MKRDSPLTALDYLPARRCWDRCGSLGPTKPPGAAGWRDALRFVRGSVPSLWLHAAERRGDGHGDCSFMQKCSLGSAWNCCNAVRLNPALASRVYPACLAWQACFINRGSRMQKLQGGSVRGPWCGVIVRECAVDEEWMTRSCRLCLGRSPAPSFLLSALAFCPGQQASPNGFWESTWNDRRKRGEGQTSVGRVGWNDGKYGEGGICYCVRFSQLTQSTSIGVSWKREVNLSLLATPSLQHPQLPRPGVCNWNTKGFLKFLHANVNVVPKCKSLPSNAKASPRDGLRGCCTPGTAILRSPVGSVVHAMRPLCWLRMKNKTVIRYKKLQELRWIADEGSLSGFFVVFCFVFL